MRRTLPALLLALAACSGGFDPYNLVQGPRLLAVRAEPPTLEPDGTALIEPLVAAPEGTALEYAWSWCPLRGGAAQGYACLVSEEELRAQLAARGAALEAGYDLGSAPRALLRAPARPAALAALCEGLAAALPRDVDPIACDQGFPISVGLVLRAGGEDLRAFKQVRLALDAATPRNHNPQLAGVALGPQGTPRATALAVGPGDRPALAAGRTYALWADVPDASSEAFVRAFDASVGGPRAVREDLTLTWFVEAGSTRWVRTSYVFGDASLDALSGNEWTPPASVPAAGAARLTLVLRDERGGAAWLARDFTLTR